MPIPSKPMSERELLSQLKQEQTAAESFIEGTAIATQRAKNMRYYQDGTLGNEIEGRSKVKDRTVFETVEWIMPQLMEMFASSKTAVEFEPETANDVEAAEQATDYVNYVFMRQNNGFLVLHDWFKDALIEKTGIVKAEWVENMNPRLVEYNNVDEDELTLLLESEDAQLLEIEEIGTITLEGPEGLREAQIFNAKIAVTERDGHVNVEVVPPESFVVRAGTVNLREADYCGEMFLATESELLGQGFAPEKVKQITFNDHELKIGDQGRYARGYLDQTSYNVHGRMANAHPSMRKAIITEAYIRLDFNGDGITELLQVFHDENVILAVEEVDTIPYLDLSSIRIPHKLIGMAVADVVRDLQEIKTTIMRGIMDHMYATLNGRYAVVDGAVNLADLFDPVPGGAVRQTAPGMVEALSTPPLDPQTFSLLQYIDTLNENRSGVNKVQQGVDRHVLGSNVATGAMDTAMRAAQQRIAMLGRLFAETGVKELFYRIYSLVRQHQDKEEIVRLRDRFVPVRPFDWQDRKDMVVTVGVGNVSPTEKMAEMALLRDTMQIAANANVGVISPANIYNFGIELAKAMGRKDYNKFFTEPPQKPPPPEPDIDQQIKLQELELEKLKTQLEVEEAQLEREKFEWQKLVDMAEIELEDKQKRAVGLQTGK